VAAGARRARACGTIGLHPRTEQRWRAQGGGEDLRAGPLSAPANKLTEAERAEVLSVANSADFQELSPKQIVPQLADAGTYLASESTFYRILRAERQTAHRERSRPPVNRPKELVATGPNQIWSWDITYMPSNVRGTFFFHYLFVDIFSRKIVGHAVHERESMEHAATLVREAAAREDVRSNTVTLHADNGGPMKGATMLATLQRLGIVASFSRPHTSDDNPFSESLFRTMKYRPEYPDGPFSSLDEARAWVAAFIDWYNNEHLHSAIRFVTPAQRHRGEAAVLQHRARVYAAARARTPQRWRGPIRNWTPAGPVTLNPDPARHTAGARA
jgi:transposase InsO family protein